MGHIYEMAPGMLFLVCASVALIAAQAVLWTVAIGWLLARLKQADRPRDPGK